MVVEEGKRELQELMSLAMQESRDKRAREWKESGGLVVGVLSPYVPIEILTAAGILPYRVIGICGQGTARASLYRPESTDKSYTHMLEALLSGHLDFIDGVVTASSDDDMRRLYDVFVLEGGFKFNHMLYLPHQQTELGLHEFTRSIENFLKNVSNFVETETTDGALREAIAMFNHARSLLRSIYGLRKDSSAPISGSEALGMSLSMGTMPPGEFAKRAQRILEYLRSKQEIPSPKGARVLVSGDKMDITSYVRLVEETGAVVAMDDLDTGSRSFWDLVNEQQEPVQALAARYLNGPSTARMFDWDRQIDRTIFWAREYAISGVIDMPLVNDFPREFRQPYYLDRLAKAGLPNISIRHAYCFENIEQIRTRIEAFLEMLS